MRYRRKIKKESDQMEIVSEKADVGENVSFCHGVIIEDDVQICDNVSIGNYTKVQSGSVIEKNSRIGDFCIIGHETKQQLLKTTIDDKLKSFVNKETRIGENSIIRSHSVIYQNVITGKNFNTGHHVIIREHTTFGKKCLVGSNTVLNGFSRIGDFTRINTMCALPQSVKIGRGVFIAPMVTFSDNKNALPGEGNMAATIEDYVRIGVGVKILPELTIHKHALIGAGSVVTKDIPEGFVAYGTPCKVIKKQSKRGIEKYIKYIEDWK